MKTKTCKQCGITKPISKYYKEKKKVDGEYFYKSVCKKCDKENWNQWRKDNPERVRETALRYYKKLRLAAINHYSNGTYQCACCGEDHIEFLAIDHVDGNGAEHRRKVGQARETFQWLKNNGYPEGFQVLCANCNWGKHVCGICPHEQERQGIYDPLDPETALNYKAPRNLARRCMLTHNGKTMTISEWAKETGIKRQTIAQRLRRDGMSVDEALTIPPHPYQNKKTTIEDALIKPVRKKRKNEKSNNSH